MNNNQPYYSAADYQRYHAGEMSPAEMHALEKAAMADPFLQDALDGYAFTKSGEQEMILLKARLLDGLKKEKRGDRPFAFWLRIAAVLIIAASVAFFIYKSADKDPAQVLAKNDKEEIPFVTDNNIPLTPSTENNQEVIAQTEVAANTERADKKTGSVPVISNTDEMEDISVQSKTTGARNDRDITFKSQTTPSTFYLEGKVVDEKGRAVENAAIIAKDKTLAKTETDGSFSIATNENPVNVEITMEGYARKKEQLNANTNATVRLDKVKATTIGSPNNSMSTPTNTETVTSTDGTPVEGWETYNTYINKNKGILYGEDGNKQVGRVMLAFKIDNNGTPKDIVIKYSSQVKANAKAIELLEKGPKWNGKTDTFYDLIIDF